MDVSGVEDVDGWIEQVGRFCTLLYERLGMGREFASEGGPKVPGELREAVDGLREAGGTFLGTADVYNDGASERIVGRLVAAERDTVVLGTKFTLPTDRNDPNSGGSHRKNLRRSVEERLRRPATDHVDLLWVHAWDECTAAEETLRALDDLVRSGKVLAVG